MNNFVEQTSNFLAVLLGFNIMTSIIRFFDFNIETVNLLSSIYYSSGFFLVVITGYFLFKNRQEEKEINEMKKKQAEKDKDEESNIF